MRFPTIVIGVCLIASTWLGCNTTPLEQRSWTYLETEHFEILSDAGQERSVELAREFEAFHAFIQELVGIQKFEPAIPTRVFFLTDPVTYRKVAPPRTAGYFLPTPAANYVVVGEIGSLNATEVAFHEYSHYLMRSAGLFGYPVWFDEGHAEFLSTVRVRKGLLELGGVPLERVRTIQALGTMSLKSVIEANGFERWSPEDVSRFYAQSWALVHYLYFTRENGEPVRWRQKDEFLSLVNQKVPIEEAFERAFGMTYIAMERELSTYFRRRVGMLGFPADRYLAHVNPSVTALGQADVARKLADLALTIDNVAMADDLLARAGALEPEDVRTLALLARVQTERGDVPGAQKLLERAVELAPEDAALRIGYGKLLVSKAMQRDGSFAIVPQQVDAAVAADALARGRAELERAIQLAPRSPEAHLELGFSYLFPGDDVAKAAVHADRAFNLLPSDPRVALLLGESLVRARQGAEALPVLTRLVPYLVRYEAARPFVEGLIAEAEAQIAGTTP